MDFFKGFSLATFLFILALLFHNLFTRLDDIEHLFGGLFTR